MRLREGGGLPPGAIPQGADFRGLHRHHHVCTQHITSDTRDFHYCRDRLGTRRGPSEFKGDAFFI